MSVHDPSAHDAEQAGAWAGDTGREPFEIPGGGRVLLGTASWTDPTMTASGVFYPREATSAEDRLAYYASRFPLVEVDATYYALPTPRLAELWRDRTPPDLTFDVKAHALMTGQPTETKRLPKAIRDALPPHLASKPRIYGKDLPESRCLEGWSHSARPASWARVLLQYPRWFFPSHESRDAILEARDRLAGLEVAVEFRHGSWFNEKNAERTLRLSRRARPALRDGRRAARLPQQRAARRRPSRRSDSLWCASTGVTPRHGRPKA